LVNFSKSPEFGAFFYVVNNILRKYCYDYLKNFLKCEVIMPGFYTGGFAGSVKKMEKIDTAQTLLVEGLNQRSDNVSAIMLVQQASGNLTNSNDDVLKRLAALKSQDHLQECAKKMDDEREKAIAKHKDTYTTLTQRLTDLQTQQPSNTDNNAIQKIVDAKLNDPKAAEQRYSQLPSHSKAIVDLTVQQKLLEANKPTTNPAVGVSNKKVDELCSAANQALSKHAAPAPHANMNKLAQMRTDNKVDKSLQALKKSADDRKDTPAGKTMKELMDTVDALDKAMEKLKAVTDKMVTPDLAKKHEDEYKKALREADAASAKLQELNPPKRGSKVEFDPLSPLASLKAKVAETLRDPTAFSSGMSPSAELVQRACDEDKINRELAAVTSHLAQQDSMIRDMMKKAGEQLANHETRRPLPTLGAGAMRSLDTSRDQKTPSTFAVKVWNEESKSYKEEALTHGKTGKPLKLNREQMRRAIALWNKNHPDEQIPPMKENFFGGGYEVHTGSASLAKRFAAESMSAVFDEDHNATASVTQSNANDQTIVRLSQDAAVADGSQTGPDGQTSQPQPLPPQAPLSPSSN
jgi:hypothetical protein